MATASTSLSALTVQQEQHQQLGQERQQVELGQDLTSTA
jgi:hypothetical protein